MPTRSPYNSDDPRERDCIPQRDLLASHPPPARNGYPPEERDYHTPPPLAARSSAPPRTPYDEAYSIPNGGYSPPPSRMNGASPSPTLPPVHKPSFSYDERPRWDDRRERDVQWEEERELREREATYAREAREREARVRIEWERERDLREREATYAREARERETRGPLRLPKPALTTYTDAGDPHYAPHREPSYASRDVARPPGAVAL